MNDYTIFSYLEKMAFSDVLEGVALKIGCAAYSCLVKKSFVPTAPQHFLHLRPCVEGPENITVTQLVQVRKQAFCVTESKN